jgi:hypothetical protein
MKRILLLALFAATCGAQFTDMINAPLDGVAIDLTQTAVSTSPINLCTDGTPGSGSGNAKDCWIGYLIVNNTSGTPVAFTGKDGQGTPFQLFPATLIPANGQVMASFIPIGQKMTGGLIVTAGAAGLQLSFHGKRAK